jgi:nitric oxide reductase NorE protein
MKETNTIHASVFYPPGGILIWIIIFVEVITFFMGIGSLIVEKSSNFEEFRNMQSNLNLGYGIWNTIFLITSGYCMALAVSYFQENKEFHVKILLISAIGFGVFFLFLKGWEYNEKLNDGYSLHAGNFWAYYWFLTGFHFLHVVAGIVILSIIYFYRKTISLENLEAGASFWHMCDLIWILLLPVLYLIR